MISGIIPALWREAAGGQHDRISTGWLPDFQDPQLTALVHEAIAENNDLRAAAHRLKATRENNIRARAGRLPQVTAGTTANRRLNGSGSSGGSPASSYGM
ncbi:MAG TPA: multidrug transporter, partial [Verrucomicrobiales bacterium]|nr:multidrug transporter [Verrucomicrobiales bacterium]